MSRRSHDYHNPDFRGIQDALARGAVRGPYSDPKTGLNLAEIATELIGSTWLKEHDAEVSREAEARALEEAAESFRVNTWLDLLKPARGMPGLTRNATAITDWLRARAAEIRGSREIGDIDE